MRKPRRARVGSGALLAVLIGGVAACSASGAGSRGTGGPAGSSGDGGSSGTTTGGSAGTTGGSAGDGGGSGATGGAPSDAAGGTGAIMLPDAGDSGVEPPAPDPATCQEAADQKSYVGCDFWPAVTTNPVWSIFDYTVMVANTGMDPADITVTRGTTTVTATAAPNALVPIYLPWVPELKGLDADVCATSTPPTASIRADGGAYHLVSTRPVTVWQFSALEFQPSGGPANKDWTTCPGNQGCPLQLGIPVGCFSFTNDASLLLPSTAMTGNYRVTTFADEVITSPLFPPEYVPAFVSITATADGTTVDVKVSATGQVVAGMGVTATGPGGILTLSMDAGDVVELVSNGQQGSDLAGSLVQADKPVQVLAGMGCAQIPKEVAACDHIEESVLPAESLGEHYLVIPPTGPLGQPVGHVVRVYGNVDATQLSYPSGTPNMAPAVINAGQAFDMGVVTQAFEIQGDHEFAIATFQQGGAAVDPGALMGTRKGDPAQSQAVAVEQYRQRYLFIAPTDYPVNYVDIIQPLTAKVILNGAQVPIAPVPIGTSAWGVARVSLGTSSGGVHLAYSDQAFGIQVVGYGTYTSYQYPGGLSLRGIAPPPPPVR